MTRSDDSTAAIQSMARRVVVEPSAWPGLRDGVKSMFDQIAPSWDQIATRPGHLDALEAALDRTPEPSAALDVGTGSGRGADLLAQRFERARVVGADISLAMLREAAARGRPRPLGFVTADADVLPFADASFDTVVALNMFVFHGEIARVLRPGGCLVVVYSGAEHTPVYVPVDVLREHLRSFTLQDGRAGNGIWVVATRH